MPLGAWRLNGLARYTVTAVAEVIRRKVGVAAIADAQVDTAQSQFGGASALFDGTDDALSIDNASGIFDFGTSDFTIEFWFRATALSGDPHLLDMRASGAYGSMAPLIYYRSSSPSGLRWYINGSPVFSVGISTATWYHVAVSRSSGTVRMFLDGTQVGSDTADTNNYICVDDWWLGGQRAALGVTGVNSWDGHIDEVRISNTARYTTGFTPSTTPFVNDENTLLLLHMDGTDGSTVFNDDNGVRAKIGVTGIIGTSAGNSAQIDTAESKFGGASALFDGTNDYILVPHVTSLDFGTGPFTIECWFYVNTALNNSTFWGANAAQAAGNYQFCIATISSVPKLRFLDNAVQINGSTTVATGEWIHCAAVREGTGTNQFKLYYNGTLDATGTLSTSFTFTDGYRIGLNRGGTAYFDGWIDELRISNTARYTTAFTPSTTPFVNDDNTLLLLHMDGTDGATVFEDDNGVRAKVGVAAIADAQVDTAESKFGGASALFDGTGDYLDCNSAIIDVQDDWTIEWWQNVAANNAGSVWQIRVSSSDEVRFVNNYNRSAAAYGLGYYTLEWGSVGGYSADIGLTTGSWQNVAVCKSGTTITIFVNGVLEETRSVSGAVTTPNSTFRIAGPTGPLNGWIDEFRISNTARYTANFTPSTTPFQNDSNTLLLLHMDGTDGSTYFPDDNGVPPDHDYS